MINKINKLIAKYAIVDKHTIYLYKEDPGRCCGSILQEVQIDIHDDNVLRIIGQEHVWRFAFKDTLAGELKELPMRKYVKTGRLSLMDFFTGNQWYYVPMGYYRLEQNRPYRAMMNTWKIIWK